MLTPIAESFGSPNLFLQSGLSLNYSSFNLLVQLFKKLNSSQWSDISLRQKVSNLKGSTYDIWSFHAVPHDFDSDNTFRKLLSASIVHLGLVSLWMACLFYAGGYLSNFDSWLTNPSSTPQLAHPAQNAFGQGTMNFDFNASNFGIRSVSGLFNIWLGMGVINTSELKSLASLSLLVSVLFLVGAYVTMHISAPLDRLTKLKPSLGIKGSIILGLGSISWSGHLFHISIPTLYAIDSGVSSSLVPTPQTLLFLNPSIDSNSCLFLPFMHHLALGIFLIMGAINLSSGKNKPNMYGLGDNWDFMLATSLLIVSTASVLAAIVIPTSGVYPYLSYDLATVYTLFTHHIWIGAFLFTGVAAHYTIGFIKSGHMGSKTVLASYVIQHRDIILGHLTWVTIFLGFHSFGLLVHNDTLSALGRYNDLITDFSLQLKPVFYNVITHTDLNPISLSNYGQPNFSVPAYAGTSEFIVAHIHAFNAHVFALILLKGLLFSRSSRLVTDKSKLGFRYPCDGPGRGGTCQISPWDHIFLSIFWAYNLSSIVIFDLFWKSQSDVWFVLSDGNLTHPSSGEFPANASNVNGWLRNFLWSQASQVLQGYATANSAYSLIFLLSHFVWALSLMFLFSGRGYWQELIESILWAHYKLKVTLAISPRALSITQGRAVGLTHYILGGIGCTWSFTISRVVTLF